MFPSLGLHGEESDVKKMKKTKTSSNYIPQELLIQILTRLPAKTLLRFRCVCKPWRSIIDDPDFIDTHRKLCNINRDIGNQLLLAYESFRRRSGREGCLMTVRRIGTIATIDKIYKNNHKQYFICGSCNGLVLTRRNLGCGNEFSIWNPSIRIELLLPPCPHSSGDARYVFGFAPERKDYKVFAFTFKKIDAKTEELSVAVYTLSDQQWTVRDNCFDISSSYIKRVLLGDQLPPSTVFFQGAAHWFGEDPYGDISHDDMHRATHLVSLNFDLEIFTFLELPHALPRDATTYFLFVLRESLAIFCIGPESASIWVLEQANGKGAWTLWFSGGSSQFAFIVFLACRLSNSKVFYHESGDGRYIICGTKFYNIVKCKLRDLGKNQSRSLELETYSESLVLGKN